MNNNIITCKQCGQIYGYELTGTVYPGGKDREEAICPYCNTVGYHKMTSQTIRSFKVDSAGNEIS